MDNKKYYYMRLKENFFDDDSMKILESMPDGYLYSNILLKMYLTSLKSEGRLMLNGIIPYSPQMIASITRHQVGTVEKALDLFEKMGLIEILDNGAIYMLNIQNFIGKGSTEADRVREYRQKISCEKKTGVQMYEKSTPEIELELELDTDIETDIETEIEKESDVAVAAPAPPEKKKKSAPKHKHGEYGNVLLTDEEYEKLKTEYPDCDQWIDRLSEYIAYKGAKYKSHYVTLRVWIRKDKDGQKPAKEKPKAQNRFLNAQQRDDNYADMLMQAAVQGMGSLRRMSKGGEL